MDNTLEQESMNPQNITDKNKNQTKKNCAKTHKTGKDLQVDPQWFFPQPLHVLRPDMENKFQRILSGFDNTSYEAF